MVIKIDSKNADKNCKHCYGRGFVGWDVDKGKIMACRCVIKKSLKGVKKDGTI